MSSLEWTTLDSTINTYSHRKFTTLKKDEHDYFNFHFQYFMCWSCKEDIYYISFTIDIIVMRLYVLEDVEQMDQDELGQMKIFDCLSQQYYFRKKDLFVRF
eukprot:TRINITY_DN5219_c0_g1_i4.p2 TRINITY_DN5219_c0_g1~~TRINITY_DN5219_c0_g1_i4.p2  ORF type:complete len:101 (-),score=10.49 TRINITY_DN5219_c0_g1_i4:2-304(-)